MTTAPRGDAATESARVTILRAAASLLTRDAGTPLAQIAAAAGVGRTTMHRTFPTRIDLLTALALQSTEHLRRMLEEVQLEEGPVPLVLDRLIRRVLPLAEEMQFLDAGPEVWDLPDLREPWCSLTSAMDALVERGQREGDLRGDLPAELIVEALTGMLWGTWQGIRDGRVAPATAARHLVRLLGDGLVTAPTARA